MSNVPVVDITTREFKADPYPFYARLRAEAPVYRTVLPDKQPAWLITRYSDVMAVLKDDLRFVKNRRNVITQEQKAKQQWVPPMFRLLMENLVDTDGEQHA